MSPRFSTLAASIVMVLPHLYIGSWLPLPSSVAASPVERIALQLNGHLCAAQHANIISALSTLTGVRAVNLSSVPGHALVDIDTAVLSTHHVIETIRPLWSNEDACLIEPMQSCISASPLGHAGMAH